MDYWSDKTRDNEGVTWKSMMGIYIFLSFNLKNNVQMEIIVVAIGNNLKDIFHYARHVLCNKLDKLKKSQTWS